MRARSGMGRWGIGGGGGWHIIHRKLLTLTNGLDNEEYKQESRIARHSQRSRPIIVSPLRLSTCPDDKRRKKNLIKWKKNPQQTGMIKLFPKLMYLFFHSWYANKGWRNFYHIKRYSYLLNISFVCKI